MTLLVPLRFTALAVKVFFEPHHCAILQSITTSSVVIVGRKHPQAVMGHFHHLSLLGNWNEERKKLLSLTEHDASLWLPPVSLFLKPSHYRTPFLSALSPRTMLWHLTDPVEEIGMRTEEVWVKEIGGPVVTGAKIEVEEDESWEERSEIRSRGERVEGRVGGRR